MYRLERSHDMPTAYDNHRVIEVIDQLLLKKYNRHIYAQEEIKMENIQTTTDTPTTAPVSPEEAARLAAVKAQLFVTTDEGNETEGGATEASQPTLH